jgi:hypothetical protein
VKHDEHDWVGVPTHVGPIEIGSGGAGAPRSLVLQQICPEQSLSVEHALGHVVEQIPSQQRGVAVPAQSLDAVHAFGHGVPPVGLRHRPAALRLGSSLLSVVQHT